jgi:DNA modification methylase
MDALDFLKTLPAESADVVLYDPPYSLRQVKEHYEGVGIKMTQENAQSSWRARHLDEIARITKPRGLCLSFGWNSNGAGMKRGFDTEEILLVPHGGSKNDTICVCERKRSFTQTSLLEGIQP